MQAAFEYDLVAFDNCIAIGTFYFGILAVEYDLGIQNIVRKAVKDRDGEEIFAFFANEIKIRISAANCGERLSSNPWELTRKHS